MTAVKNKRVCILGAGSWGRTLADLLAARAGAHVRLISVTGRKISPPEPSAESKGFLEIVSKDNIRAAVEGSDFIFFASSSNLLKQAALLVKPYVTNQILISLTKGLSPASGKTMSETLEDDFYAVSALSGGSHAEEVAQMLPFALTLGLSPRYSAEGSLKVKKAVTALLSNTPCCLSFTFDRRGVELAAALKNIVAIAVGISDGLKLGDNFRSCLMVEGLKEIADLGVLLGCQKETFYGNPGLGDLLATALSDHSRNRRFGLLIGQGKTKEEALAEVGMVVEGLNAIEAARLLAQKNKSRLKFAEEVKEIVDGEKSASAIVELGKTKTR